MRSFADRFPIVASLLLAAGCYNLPYADPGPRWIDQFNADAGVLAPPSWAVFTPWTCGTRQAPNAGTSTDGSVAGDPGNADAGVAPDAAVADGGADDGMRMACRPGAGGLVQPFAFADSSNHVEFTVETHTSGATVDFTGFRQFVFSANLSAPPAAQFPVGTVFEVELGCSKNQIETSVSQDVPDVITKINAQDLNLSRLELSQFEFNSMSSNGSCLSQIDGIRFSIQPGQNDQPEIAGTLSLGAISLQN